MSAVRGKTVAVMMGGPGPERPVSLASGEGVCRALEEAGARVIPVDLTGTEVAVPAGVDLVFNVVHGVFGEDGGLQAALERIGVPYTGEGVEGSRVAFDKILTKRRFDACGVPSARWEVLRAGDRPSLPLPLAVKTPRQGSSVGVVLVRAPGELDGALREALRYGDEVLVEELFEGRELTVGILGRQALPVIEIRPKEGFYDFKNKYPFLSPGGAADHRCPAPLGEEATRLVQGAALAAADSLGLEVYSRVDILFREPDHLCVLEINTIPGMTQASLLPEAALAAGISYPALCERIVALSLARGKGGGA